jgi:hypothetical protein
LDERLQNIEKMIAQASDDSFEFCVSFRDWY